MGLLSSFAFDFEVFDTLGAYSNLKMEHFCPQQVQKNGITLHSFGATLEQVVLTSAVSSLQLQPPRHP